jgi:DNA-binding NarL/FixJ family response regulator
LLKDPAAVRQAGPCAAITARQRQVLHLLASGLPNKDIGRQLDIAERTVKLHVQALFDLLGANNRTHAVARAREAGLLQDTAPSA